MIPEIKKNIETEIAIAKEISYYSNKLRGSNKGEERLLLGTINSLTKSLKILNDSMPELLKSVSVARELPNKPVKKENVNLEQVRMKRGDSELEVVISKKDRNRFLEELTISEDFIKKIKGREIENGEVYEEFKAARGYVKLSNRFFLNTASDLINKGTYKNLHPNFKKSNLLILFEAYIAVMLFTTFLSFFVGIGLVLFLMFFEVGFVFPFISIYDGGLLLRLVKVSWLIIAIPLITYFSLYFYPSLEKRSVSIKIDRELPFAVIHMSAISGSGINPIEIFKIIGLSKQYPNLRKEIRKVLNQINLYGYDLVTALKSVSKNSPSDKLSELLSGLATTISSGGELNSFFEKRSESLLLSYRLEREKYTKTAETFMDIYISVVIAAPMVLMLLLVLISVSNVGFQLTQIQITLLIISAVSVINIIFLGFLHVKQPAY